jgi:hypothetical protein
MMKICSECGKEIVEVTAEVIIHERWEKGCKPEITYIAHKSCYIEMLKR